MEDQKQAPTCKTKSREFIDQIMLELREAKRMVEGSFEEFTYGVSEGSHPFDHCPVAITVRSR